MDPNAHLCDPVSSTYVACIATSTITPAPGCMAQAPICAGTPLPCVECKVNSDCPVAAPVCDIATHACTAACMTSNDCQAPLGICSGPGGYCEECKTDMDCAQLPDLRRVHVERAVLGQKLLRT